MRQAILEKLRSALSKHIDALDTDIGRELDSERKLMLQDQRQELEDGLRKIAEQLALFKRQLSQ